MIKNFILLILLGIVFSFSGTACLDDDDDVIIPEDNYPSTHYSINILIGKPDEHLISQEELDDVISLFELNGLNYDNLQFYRLNEQPLGKRHVRCYQYINNLKAFMKEVIFHFDEFDVYEDISGEIISEINVSSDILADYRDIVDLYLIELEEDEEFINDKDEIRNGVFVLEFGYFDVVGGKGLPYHEFITAWKIYPKDNTYPMAYISDVSEEVLYYDNGIWD